MVKTELIESIISRHNFNTANLIMILQDTQEVFNYLPPDALEYISNRLEIPKSQVYSIATFFKSFSLTPRGKHKIDICEGTACHIRGASLLLSSVTEEFNIKAGETSTDGLFSLNSVHCVGACAMGPVAIIDGEYHGNITSSSLVKKIKQCCAEEHCVENKSKQLSSQEVEPENRDLLTAVKSFDDYNKLREKLTAKYKAINNRILVCTGTGCLAKGSIKVAHALTRELDNKNINIPVHIGVKKVGCHGLCEQGPLIIIHPGNICYTKVNEKDVKEIIEKTYINKTVVERLLYRDSADSPAIEKYTDIPFYSSQVKIALRNVGEIDPANIADYIARGGYGSLKKVLQDIQPEAVIDKIDKSGLRGRGGGGFPAGKKWRTAAAVNSDLRYVICNGDEGDPGAFMDCSIMEGDPHAVLEGMAICAYAIRASQGYIYVREEYPRALIRMQQAIEQALESGFLGDNLFGTDFSFKVKINRGAGAFVCGESTALMQSVEGKVGEPRAKYIRSAERGLYDKPTVLNNVETFANVPIIIDKGVQWFRSYGSDNSKGTKVFSVVGKVKNTGLVEVPMGTTLRNIIYDICGGIIDGGRFKAVQTGGPSGGCLPAEKLDLPVDFDSLTREGSMMGSGGMIVMDEHTCMVDVARYFTDFLTSESCGKCAACRLGLEQVHAILDRICKGKGVAGDLDNIEKLLHTLQHGSLCGLGKSAPNPVRSTLDHFKDEYIAHIEEKKCPAGVCRELISYKIEDSCTGCRRCARACPQGAISGEKKVLHIIDQDLCNRCGICITLCNFDAITVD